MTLPGVSAVPDLKQIGPPPTASGRDSTQIIWAWNWSDVSRRPIDAAQHVPAGSINLVGQDKRHGLTCFGRILVGASHKDARQRPYWCWSRS